MFAKSVIDTDTFLEMPIASQLLYFHLAMRADDDGFVDKPKTIMRMVGAKDDDMKVLIAKGYVLVFDTGVIVIKHWRLHNYIQKDRYKETVHKDEKAQLTKDKNGEYQLVSRPYPNCIQDVSEVETQVRLGDSKDSIGKNINTGKPQRFKKPTLDELTAYVNEKHYHFDPVKFWNYYESNGWKVGKNPMKNWHSCCVTWEANYKIKEAKGAKRAKEDFDFMDLLEGENNE